jgi:5-methyltetrahydropteroyltriglutamate--homocysteine methyltransferase
VGSLLRSPALIEARAGHHAGDLDGRSLADAERQAIEDAVAMQERVGLQVVTDGELRRLTWNHDFLCELDNVVYVAGDPPTLQVRGRLGRSHPIAVADFENLRQLTHAAPKITVPAPDYMLGRGRAVEYDQSIYPDPEAFAADIAAVYRREIVDLAAAGCRHLQLDDPNFAFLCDPVHRERAESQSGRSADELLHSYVDVINAALADRPPGLTVTLHTCRGNFRSRSFAAGGYASVAEILLGELAVDGYLLEYHDPELCGGFAPLAAVPDDKFVVLGLISTKTGELEDRDWLRRRLDDAAAYIDLDRVAVGTQCGFASTVEGNLITPEQQEGKLRFLVELADEVWA